MSGMGLVRVSPLVLKNRAKGYSGEPRTPMSKFCFSSLSMKFPLYSVPIACHPLEQWFLIFSTLWLHVTTKKNCRTSFPSGHKERKVGMTTKVDNSFCRTLNADGAPTNISIPSTLEPTYQFSLPGAWKQLSGWLASGTQFASSCTSNSLVDYALTSLAFLPSVFLEWDSADLWFDHLGKMIGLCMGISSCCSSATCNRNIYSLHVIIQLWGYYVISETDVDLLDKITMQCKNFTRCS